MSADLFPNVPPPSFDPATDIYKCLNDPNWFCRNGVSSENIHGECTYCDKLIGSLDSGSGWCAGNYRSHRICACVNAGNTSINRNAPVDGLFPECSFTQCTTGPSLKTAEMRARVATGKCPAINKCMQSVLSDASGGSSIDSSQILNCSNSNSTDVKGPSQASPSQGSGSSGNSSGDTNSGNTGPCQACQPAVCTSPSESFWSSAYPFFVFFLLIIVVIMNAVLIFRSPSVVVPQRWVG